MQAVIVDRSRPSIVFVQVFSGMFVKFTRYHNLTTDIVFISGSFKHVVKKNVRKIKVWWNAKSLRGRQAYLLKRCKLPLTKYPSAECLNKWADLPDVFRRIIVKNW